MTEATQKRIFKKAANVTLQLLKIVANQEYYVRFTGAMHLGKATPGKADPTTGEIKSKEPAHVAFVDNLENDQEQMIICSTVLRKELAEAFPNDSYVGKCFGFKQTRVAGKDYNLVEIWLVEDPDAARSADVLAKFNAAKASAVPAPAAADSEEKPKAGKK